MCVCVCVCVLGGCVRVVVRGRRGVCMCVVVVVVVVVVVADVRVFRIHLIASKGRRYCFWYPSLYVCRELGKMELNEQGCWAPRQQPKHANV